MFANTLEQKKTRKFSQKRKHEQGKFRTLRDTLMITSTTTGTGTVALDAAWVELEAFKQLDEQNKLQLAELVKENVRLQAEVEATNARA